MNRSCHAMTLHYDVNLDGGPRHGVASSDY